jgi:hypothetical protein
MAPMVYSGARGKTIHDKKPEVENLVSETLCFCQHKELIVNCFDLPVCRTAEA